MDYVLTGISYPQLAFLNQRITFDLSSLKQSTQLTDRRRLTYLISYPHFLDFFAAKDVLTESDLVLGASLVYSWMPTALAWKSNNFSQVTDILNTAKETNSPISSEDFLEVSRLVNGSIVGTSKLLHFVNPSVYPIWDSKINRLLHDGDSSDTNSIERYQEYYDLYFQLKSDPRSHQVTKSLGEKTGYEITFARAFEMILFLAGEDLFEESKAIVETLEPARPAVPRYKRDQYIFISNLNKSTASEIYPITYKRDGYLLSEHYMTRSSIQLAAEVKTRDNLLISDNGNFSRIKRIAAEFSDPGLDILNSARKELIDTGQVSTETTLRRKELMNVIGEHCRLELEQLDINEITAKQLSIAPDYMIGMEDYAIPVMMLCNLMHPAFSPAASDVLSYQQRTLSLYNRQEAGHFGSLEQLKGVTNFLVLHAYDYASAFQAAVLSKDQFNEGVAISYGGPMLSNRWISSLDIGGYKEIFDEKLPESYLIAQSLTLGIINGNPKSIPYHILGVGTPILIALIGYQLRHASAVSIDSTAPFKDAYAGTLYGDKQAYIKMDMYRVAASHLIAGTAFTSNTPFFKFFDQDYPADWQGLRDKMGVTPSMNYKALARELEERLDLLEQYIPFFSKMRSGNDEMMKRLRVCRAGHNFWILRRICRNVIKYRTDEQAFQQWIERQVDRYTSVASYKWAKAVEKTYELTEKFRAF
ncbi:MAG: hypothetical protein AAFZ63_17865 [Bacteroidota bacterium]